MRTIPKLAAALCACVSLVGWPAAGSQPKRLTNVNNSYPCPSPDGRTLVFQSDRTGRWEIYVMPIDGGPPIQVTNEPGNNVTPTWSPDGRKIAFASAPGGNSEIFVMNADGSGRTRLTDDPGDDSHPHWWPDGARIIFNSSRTTPTGAGEQDDVFSMRPDGSDLRQHTRSGTICTYPSVSPDGTRIAYRKVVAAAGFAWDLTSTPRNSEVFVANLDGTNEVNLSKNAAFDGWPAWSPDGRRIAFSSNRAGPANVGHIYVVNADGTGLRQITSGSWSFAQPSWSRDGTWIFAYQLQETPEYEFGDVAVVDVE